MGHDRFVFAVPAVDFQTPWALFDGSFVSLESGLAVKLVLDQVGVVWRVAEVVIERPVFSLVDFFESGIECAIGLTVNPDWEVCEGDGLWGDFLFFFNFEIVIFG